MKCPKLIIGMQLQINTSIMPVYFLLIPLCCGLLFGDFPLIYFDIEMNWESFLLATSPAYLQAAKKSIMAGG